MNLDFIQLCLNQGNPKVVADKNEGRDIDGSKKDDNGVAREAQGKDWHACRFCGEFHQEDIENTVN